MKRISTFILATAFVLGSVCSAQAIDLKVKGQWDFAFGWADTSFHKDSNQDTFHARQRIRTQVNFIASEQLQGVLMFEIGTIDWGRGGAVGRGAGGALDADGVNVETKRAYLDWMIPNTEVTVRMGIQGLMLPSATGMGNPVLNSDVAGITINAPITDMIGITAFWVRPFDNHESDTAHSGDRYDEMDMFAVMLPVTGEGWKVTPWASYASIGSASGFLGYTIDNMDAFNLPQSFDGNTDSRANAWWLGLAFNLDLFDPLTFSFDAMYGKMGTMDTNMSFTDPILGPMVIDQDVKTGGWFIDAALNYKMDWATAGLFGWYSSGDDADDASDGHLGRMPVIGFDSGFTPTTFGAPGSSAIAADTAISETMLGTWGVGVQLADMSFVDKLTHTLRIAYYRGTNDSGVVEDGNLIPISGEVVYFTDEDSAIEVNFDHFYQMYDNLRLGFEISYIHLWMDDDVWSDSAYGEYDKSNAWKAQMLFQYKF